MNEDGVAHEAFTRLAAAADEFEGYAHPHAERIAALCGELAKLFGLGRADRVSLRLAALAHDLGEMAMKRDYIRRAAPLTFEERLDLARHPVIGEQEAARAGADRGAQLLVRWHQEWWNGAGYPDALSREQIPLAARILRVADAYAALTDARPFRPARTEEEARRHLAEWAGLEFDPHVVRAFLTLKNLPALRSFAPREEEATATTTITTADGAAMRDEGGSNSPAVDVQSWNDAVDAPTAGTNSYAELTGANAASASQGGGESFRGHMQDAGGGQEFSDSTKADLTKAD